ncbi:MAG: sugar O-acetyltransferase [Clostridia bacterium]|nr:sugar O-acetyltransferase [Clostridia bacterium]
MTERERMEQGLLYLPEDPELAAEQLVRLDKLFDYNALKPSEQAKKQALLKEMFAEIGEDCYIETPFHANFGGKKVHFGAHIYANFNLTLVDDEAIYVGDLVKFGPNVTICTAAHPILPELRRKVYQFNLPVHIGSGVWIGAGAIVLPGVSIGENSVIGAGSVVTKDIPANVVAVGNPCRVLRDINENDKIYYYKDRKIDIDIE